VTSDLSDEVAALLSALQKLPPYPEITFRGMSEGARYGLQPGEAIVTTGLTATSRDLRIATENFSSPGVYAIAGRTGRAIEKFSTYLTEREVVFLPSTLFRVVEQARLRDLPLIVVEELDLKGRPAKDPHALRTLLDDIATRFLHAQQRQDVPVTTPGKFVGTIE
jgi:hypothetical protein